MPLYTEKDKGETAFFKRELALSVYPLCHWLRRHPPFPARGSTTSVVVSAIKMIILGIRNTKIDSSIFYSLFATTLRIRLRNRSGLKI
jgi:hypothetical protein